MRRLRSRLWVAAVLVGLAVVAGAQSEPRSTAGADTRFVESLPRYQASERVSGTIRLWGHGSLRWDFTSRLMKDWTDGFRKHHPDVTIEDRNHGTASAIGALYTGAGEVAILGEEIMPAHAVAFERALGYPPFKVEVATGSLDVWNMDYAHVFFVHRDNPLSRLTLAQLEGIYGTEHRRGPANIRTWGQLGLTGEWTDKRVRPYGWALDDDFALLFLQDALLAGSRRWNNEVKTFPHLPRPDGTIYDHGQRIVDALSADRYGIAVSNLRYARRNPGVKPLAVATVEGGPYYEATRATVISRDYPFTRIIPAYINRAPGRPLDPKVREFLRFLLSREGQQGIVRHGGYLPLGEPFIREELRKLQ